MSNSVGWRFGFWSYSMITLSYATYSSESLSFGIVNVVQLSIMKSFEHGNRTLRCDYRKASSNLTDFPARKDSPLLLLTAVIM